MGSHSGTHIDAPLHFLKGGMGVDRMPLNIAVGRARVLEISGRQSIQPEELAGAGIRPGERILFKTRNSSYVWQAPAFVEDYVFVSQKAARLLAQRQVALVGVDYLSVGGPGEGRLTHEILLGSGIWIVEGLDLSGVAPGSYDLVCLPLRLDDGDGAPARAVLRPVWKRAK